MNDVPVVIVPVKMAPIAIGAVAEIPTPEFSETVVESALLHLARIVPNGSFHQWKRREVNCFPLTLLRRTYPHCVTKLMDEFRDNRVYSADVLNLEFRYKPAA
jgi:hypothetical protein